MDQSLVKLPTHEHPLTISSRFVNDYCKACQVKGPIYGGYRCNEPDCVGTIFHKDCAEAPQEITNHPFHPQHCLQLSHFPSEDLCSLCGKLLFGYAYRCSETCSFVVELTCLMKPTRLSIEHPKSHEHPLVFLERREKKLGRCELCKGLDCGYSYACLECDDVYFHVGCVDLSQEVNHPSHPQHTLKLIAYGSLTSDDAEKTCLLCRESKQNVFFHCSLCNFAVCRFCTKNPPPLAIEHHKTHEHRLVLLSRHISFVCNACGMQGDRSPYMCVQCGFLEHRTCIDLPRVININRHDHRLSFTYHLGVGYSKCPICRKIISEYNGAYSCSLCPNYAAHSLCATRKDVWDGIELEGTPDDNEDIAPFKVVGDDLINHFSHQEHNLRLNNDNMINDRQESSRCEACVLPIYSDTIYKCEECDFILHEKCANLPRKKRLVFDTKPFTLHTPGNESYRYRDGFICHACGTKSTGFRYISNARVIDVRCGSGAEPFVHDGHHIHSLYYEMKYDHYCDACRVYIDHGYLLCCDACNFDLDLRCANLPKVVKHRCDDHPLSLCYGENAKKGKYWCDICEAETDPSKWFYTCSDCGVTAHINCVLGDFSRLMPGSVIKYNRFEVEVIPNHRNYRPLCAKCQSRCRAPFILKLCDPYTGYICSEQCVMPVNRYS